MSWYRLDTTLEVLCVAADFPEGVLSIGPAHHKFFHLQELVTDREALRRWGGYCDAAMGRMDYISLFTDLSAALAATKRYDQLPTCYGCGLPLLDHSGRSIMDAPLEERLAFCLRAHVNAAKQNRTLSDNVKRMTADALNDYEESRKHEAVPPPPPPA